MSNLPDLDAATMSVVRDLIDKTMFDLPPGVGYSVGLISGAVPTEEQMVFGGELISGNRRRKPSPHTSFPIGQLSKTFTAWRMASGVCEGSFHLSDKLEQWLPQPHHAIDQNLRNIALGSLADFTSGLPDDTSSYATMVSKKSWPERFSVSGRKVAPNRGYAYSNLGYQILGDILLRDERIPYGWLNNPELELEGVGVFSPDKPVLDMFDAHGHQLKSWHFPSEIPVAGLTANTFAMMSWIKLNLGLTQSTKYREVLALVQKPTVKISTNCQGAMAWRNRRLVTANGVLSVIEKDNALPGVSGYLGMVKETQTGVFLIMNQGGRSLVNCGRSILEVLNQRQNLDA